MRELMRIPVFNRESATGWGQTNESRRVLTEGLTPEIPRVPRRQGRGLHERRPAPPAPVVHRRHLRRALPLRQRQGQHPRLPHPPRRHALRQDHPDPEPAHRPRPARAEVSAHRLRLRQRRGRRAAAERRQDPRRARRSTASIFSAIDGDTMEVAWQIRVDGNLDNVDADYQGKYCFSTCYNSEKGITLADMMAADEDWVVVFNLGRIEAAVAAGEAEIINGVPVARRHQGLALHPLHPGRQRPARHQHRARRHPRRRQRQAVADRHGLRRAPVRRPLRRQDRAARHRRRRAGARPRAAAHRLRRQGQRLHHAVHRQPGLQVEHRGRQARLPGRAGRSDPPEARRPLPAGPQPHLDGPDQGSRRQVADLAQQVLQGPLPERRAAEARVRPARSTSPATRW